jgi:dTDP-L-rhamnose 4-epimerase
VRILVSGGLGFIGAHVVAALTKRGHEVRVLDALLPLAHGEGAVAPSVAAAEVVVADVRDPDAVSAALGGVDAVCHQAAMVGLGVRFDDVTGYVEHNDLGTAVLLRAMAEARCVPLVLASSCVVYGESPVRCPEHGPVPGARRTAADLKAGRFDPACPACGRPLEPDPLAESAPVDPRNVYAATKLHQEHLGSVYARECDRPVTALRYHNVYGPGMPRDTPYAGVAAIFRSALERGEAPAVFEDGCQYRDFVHVADVAHANVLALEADLGGFTALNVSTGSPRTVGEMAAELTRALRPDLRPVVTGEYRLGDVRHVFCSPELIRSRLGFTAAVGFEQGMRELATADLRPTAPPRE